MTVWTTMPFVQRWMAAALLLAIALVNIHQPYPDLAPLQHFPTALLALSSPWLVRRWPVSTASFATICSFLLLHTLAGRYIYSYVPYDDWTAAILGHRLSDLFGWHRNHFDRLVHFAFGLMWTLPVAEVLRRHHGVTAGVALFVGFAFVGLISAVYEIFEWGLTIVAAGDTADYYNGQQGDIWDPQKDMACALVGSALILGWRKVRRRV